MSQMISTVPLVSGTGRSAGSRIVDAAARHLRAFLKDWELRRAAREIGGLDERLLADIGLGPGQAESAVRHGRFRRLPPAEPGRADAPLMPPSWTEWR